MWGTRRGARYTCATVRMASTNKVCALPRILRIPREIFYQTVISFFATDLALAHDVSSCGMLGKMRVESLERRSRKKSLVRMARCRRYLRSVTAVVGAERLPPVPTEPHCSTPKGVPQQEDKVLSSLNSHLSTLISQLSSLNSHLSTLISQLSSLNSQLSLFPTKFSLLCENLCVFATLL